MNALKILIVEDEFIIATNLKMMLEDLGYEPLSPTGNEKEAIEILQTQEVDMAILDINLNGKHEGITVGKYIYEHLSIPFLYLTSNSDKGTIQEAKLTHPNSYLIKPFTSEDIYSAIEMAIAGSPTKAIRSEPNKEAEEQVNILANCIFVKLGNKYCKVEIADITYFEADGKLMNIYTIQNQRFSIRQSLEGLFTQLKPFNFIRVHRSFCINSKHLSAINNEYVIVNNQQIPLGRNFREELLGRIKTLS
jgi:two-component system response regulator LytT